MHPTRSERSCGHNCSLEELNSSIDKPRTLVCIRRVSSNGPARRDMWGKAQLLWLCLSLTSCQAQTSPSPPPSPPPPSPPPTPPPSPPPSPPPPSPPPGSTSMVAPLPGAAQPSPKAALAPSNNLHLLAGLSVCSPGVAGKRDPRAVAACSKRARGRHNHRAPVRCPCPPLGRTHGRSERRHLPSRGRRCGREQRDRAGGHGAA